MSALSRGTEYSRVQYGQTALEYQILRSSRIKTVSIAIVPQQGLVVTAPHRASKHRLDQIVRQKAAWAIRRLKRQSDLPPALPEREFVTGEAYKYLGRQYRLRVRLDDDATRVRLHGGSLDVLVGKTGEEERAEETRAALVAWFKARAAAYLPRRATPWAKKLGLSLPEILVTEPQKRWGSASKDGSLRINWRVMQAPATLVDYVLVHELAHLIHEDHSRAFWATVGRVLPDYEERKARLRELGAWLVW